jgi:hypothetical protein
MRPRKKIDDVLVVHHSFDPCFVPSSLRQKCPVVLVIDGPAFPQNAPIVLDEIRPQNPRASDQVFVITFAGDPLVYVDALTVIPGL